MPMHAPAYEILTPAHYTFKTGIIIPISITDKVLKLPAITHPNASDRFLSILFKPGPIVITND